jgi:glycosyltransferase involved in cell wall biosynthesis
MRVDVLLPYYGDVSMMKTAVRSILDQESPHWRLVVVDDGYPDESVQDYFSGLCRADERVSYVRNDANLGANRNYQKALSYIDSEFAVVMGADDVMLPNYVDVIHQARARFPLADMIQPAVRVIDDDGNPAAPMVDRVKGWLETNGRSRILAGESLATSLLRGNWLYFPAICWRADALTAVGFRRGLNVVQDLALALDIVTSGGSLFLAETLAFEYRRHLRSDSSQRAVEGTRFIEEGEFFRAVAEEFRHLGWNKAERAARVHLSSRLHAATQLPKAVQAGSRQGMSNLGRHIVGRS